MQKRKIISVLLAFAVLSGCAARQEVSKFEGDIPNTMCIARHAEVREGFLDALQEGFEAHGVSTRIINASYLQQHGAMQATIDAEEAAGCTAIVHYTANWNWDLALYMSYANIWITDEQQARRLSQASYISRHGLDKFIDAREKVLELVNNMVGKA